MTLVVPLTGSMVAGPLGVAHLPRMWQKGLLKSVGVLPDDYVFAERGFDQRMMDGIGLDAAAFVAYLATLPTYLETEAWVRKNATKLDASGECSEVIVNRTMTSEFAQMMRDRCGIADANFGNGARLNNLDDLESLRDFVIAHRGKPVTPIAPAVSSFATGPLGVLHLPRFWAKGMIDTLGALPEGYHAGKGPLDEQLAEAIGMDLGARNAFIRSELPSYIAFEDWVRTHATKLNPAAIEPWNERMRTREKPEHVAAPERALLGITDSGERRGVLLNDLVDWHYFHADVAAARK